MSEFEEKLSSILGDSQAMSQIMALAQNLGAAPQEPPVEEPSPVPVAPAPANSPDLSGLLGSLDQIDPHLLQTGMQLFSELSAQDDKKAALLLALRPFLSPQRQSKVDRAVQIARMTRLLRVAFRLFQGKEADDV